MRDGSGPIIVRGVDGKQSVWFAPADRTAASSLRRLKFVGVLLPITFIVAIECLRFTVVESHAVYETGGHIVLGVAMTVAVVVFALMMFRAIAGVQREVVRQNHELASINAVSTAMQGKVEVDEMMDAALGTLMQSSGAAEVSVAVFSPSGEGEDERSTLRTFSPALPRSPEAGVSDHPLRVVDVPLATETSLVGRMRLQVPSGGEGVDVLSQLSLQNIAYQLACSIQRGHLVGDLRRRQQEGHAFYDVMLQISNQLELGHIAGAIIAYSRDLLGADRATLTLNEVTARALSLDGSAPAGPSFERGLVCASSPDGGLSYTVPQELASSPGSGEPPREPAASLAVPIRSGSTTQGELLVGRASGEPFSARDRECLRTLSDLASIAITSARMRQNEWYGAILRERERLAHEMHDSLAQLLGVIHLNLRALESRAADDVISRELDKVADLAEEAYGEVREAILDLRASRVDEALVDGLRAYLRRYSEQFGIETTLDNRVQHNVTLPPHVECQIIRVIQEALANVRKHSGASWARVGISEEGEMLVFEIEDNGRGFDPEAAPAREDSVGLLGMGERMASIHGTLSVGSRAGRGTRVIATVPHLADSRPREEVAHV